MRRKKIGAGTDDPVLQVISIFVLSAGA